MKTEPIEIQLYDKREKMTSTIYVEQLSEFKFRMVENDLFNCQLTLGTEFETRINKEGKHEIVRITKESEFVTRRFLLSTGYSESTFGIFGNELMKRRGFWQVDMGGIVTINIPKELESDVEQLIKDLELHFTEIVEN